MAAAITSVSPGYAKLADVLSVNGTGGAAGDKVYVRARGDTAWITVDPANITAFSVDHWHLTLANPIASGGGVNWTGGLWDIGISATGGSTPTTILEDAIYFYVVTTADGLNTISGAPTAVYIDGRYVGHIDGSVDLDHAVETFKRMVNESMFPVRTYKVGESASVKIPLAEITLENIKDLWGLAAGIITIGATRILTFGGEAALPDVSVMLILPGPGSKAFALTFYTCAVVASGTFSFVKGAGVVLPVTLEVQADTTRAVNDQVGRWEEYTPA